MSAIGIHPTPNPNSLKFTLADGQFISRGMLSASTPEEAPTSDLIRKLLSIPGAANVLMLPDFATLTKRPEADWADVLPTARAILTEFAQGLR